MADLVVTEAAFGALEAEDRHGVPLARMIRSKYQGLAESGKWTQAAVHYARGGGPDKTEFIKR